MFSLSEIKEILYAKRCIHRHTIHEHPNCFDDDGNPKFLLEPRKVNILCIDIETLPILGYSWDVWNQNIYPNMVKKDWCLLSYSAKWIDSPNIISNVLSPKEATSRNDLKLAKEIWNLLEKADIIIGHNSKRFDIKKINTRFWKHDLNKPSSFKHIDTLTAAKSVFGLTYNKLQFIAEFKGIQDKLDTDFELWDRCDAGDKEALQKMLRYNERDVEIQEQVYFKMRNWIPNHPRLDVISNLNDVCPICLGNNYKEIGVYTANAYQYPEYRCSCGAVWHSTKSINKK